MVRHRRFKHVKGGFGRAIEVLRLPGAGKPRRFRFLPGIRRHRGIAVRQRLGFIGGRRRGKVVEVAFVRARRR